jgi:hypothetical protein
MTDPVDELLNEAGARWRAEQPSAPRPDQTRWRSRRWLPAVAAALVLIAAGGVYAVTRPAESVPFGIGKDTSMVVREGAEVEATGLVTGTPMRLCAPATTTAINAGSCPHSVPVTGLDVAPDGEVRLRGIWRAGVLEVKERLDPLPDPVRDHAGTPCAPPAGGWRSGQADGKELHRYVLDEHPELFRRPWASYPDGPSGADVLVVEVVAGDVETAGQELRSRYSGNLCVVDAAGKPSLKDQKGIRDAVNEPLLAIMRDEANGVYGLGGTDTVQVDLVMLTPALAERFEKISPALELRPWLRPVN